MKKIVVILAFIILCSVALYGDESEEQEAIGYLLFLPNSSTSFVNEELAMAELDTLADYLMDRNLESGQIAILGYAAIVPNAIDPLDLSIRRAQFVQDELLKRGLEAALFADPIGYGEVDLWGDNSAEADRSPNRRVRILLGGGVEVTPSLVASTPVLAPAAPVAAAPVAAASDAGARRFPWWLLLPLLLLLLLLIIFLSRRKKKSEETPAPQPTVVAAAPVAVAAVPIVLVTHDLTEEIRICAYFKSVDRGYPGDVDADWFNAKDEVCAKYEAEGYATDLVDGFWQASKEK